MRLFVLFGRYFIRLCIKKRAAAVLLHSRRALQASPFGGKLSALRVVFSGLPLGGKLSALRTDEGRLFCINPSSVAYATPSPTGEGLLPFRHSEAYCLFVILRFTALPSFRGLPKNLTLSDPSLTLRMTMKPLTLLRMTFKTCSGDIKADCLFFVNASF